jgi:hypothetical protein
MFSEKKDIGKMTAMRWKLFNPFLKRVICESHGCKCPQFYVSLKSLHAEACWDHAVGIHVRSERLLQITEVSRTIVAIGKGIRLPDHSSRI